MYYLNSRYYDPETGRYINADGYVSTGQGLLGLNMFAYCNNNPVNMTDPSGQFAISALLVGGALIACVFLLSGCGSSSPKTSSSAPVASSSRPSSSSSSSKPSSSSSSKPIDEKARLAVAQTIYGEERGYSISYKNGTTAKQGQEAVAWTIINRYRSSSYPNDWIAVVTQPYQFDGYNQGKAKYDKGELEAIGWDYAYELAGYMVSGQYGSIPKPDGFTEKHMYFRADTGQSHDSWDGIFRIGGNVFFYYK